MTLIQSIINECEEHINAPNCEGCPFVGPEDYCLIQHSPVNWNLEFFNDLLDKHLLAGKPEKWTKDRIVCDSHRKSNGLAPWAEPSIEITCETACTVYRTCPLLAKCAPHTCPPKGLYNETKALGRFYGMAH